MMQCTITIINGGGKVIEVSAPKQILFDDVICSVMSFLCTLNDDVIMCTLNDVIMCTLNDDVILCTLNDDVI